jgi:tetratricopeptide (TPR) repeat protein
MSKYKQLLDAFDPFYKTFVLQDKKPEQAEYLYKLGNEAFVLALSEINTHKKYHYFAQCFTLLNAALIRSESHVKRYFTNMLSEYLYKYASSIGVLASTLENFKQDRALSDQFFLSKVRETIKKHLGVLTISFTELEHQRESVSRVETLYTRMSMRMHDFLSSVINISIQMLGDRPPCKFCIFGMGSYARGEMTPYSDFEWGILVENGDEHCKNYFRKLSLLIHIRIINLGETSLRTVGIEKFKKLYDGGIFDLVNGLSFDAQHSSACRTPMGNMHFDASEVHRRFELICTPKELEALQRDAVLIEKDSMLLLELANIKPIEIVHENQDLSLYYKYMSLTVTTKDLRQQSALQKLKEDVKTFQHGLGLPINEGRFFDIKRDFYRMPDRVIERIAMILGIDDLDHNSRLEKLRSEFLFNHRMIDNLSVTLAIANFMRLSAYLEANGREECLKPIVSITEATSSSLVSFDMRAKRFFFNKNMDAIFRYYYTVAPLFEILKDISSSESVPKAIDNLNKFFILSKSSSNHLRIWLFDIARIKLFDEGKIATKAMVYQRFCEFELSIIDAKQALKYLNGNIQRSRGIVECLLKKKWEVLNLIGNCHYSQRQLEEAKCAFTECLESAKLLIRTGSDYRQLLASSYDLLGSVYADILKLETDKLCSSPSTGGLVAICINSQMLEKLNCLRDLVLENYNCAHILTKALFETSNPIEFAKILVNFGGFLIDCPFVNGAYLAQGIQYLNKAYSIFKQERVIDHRLIQLKNTLAVACIKKGKSACAYKLLDDCLDLTNRYYEAMHIQRGEILENIADILKLIPENEQKQANRLFEARVVYEFNKIDHKVKAVDDKLRILAKKEIRPCQSTLLAAATGAVSTTSASLPSSFASLAAAGGPGFR